MSDGAQVFGRLQARARADASAAGTATSTEEYLIRHVLESFLDRLTRTTHADDFVLKGGILLAAYGARRATKDVDANAVSANVTAEHLVAVVHDIARVDVADGVTFELDSITVEQIRETADYPGFRLRVKATIGHWRGVAAWDVSTGGPVVPLPRRVSIGRILGNPIELLGYAPETTIAEKGVTILERGITSTRWRDYVDIVQLASQGFNAEELLQSARAVARYRGVKLEPVTPHLDGYRDVGQAKWAAWRRKEKLQGMCAENLEDQVALVAAFLDPVFGLGPGSR